MWNVNWQSMLAFFLLLLSCTLWFFAVLIPGFLGFLSDLPSVLHTILFFFLRWKMRPWFLFKAYFKALYVPVFLQCLYQSKLICSKQADRMSAISLFPFKATEPICTSCPFPGWQQDGNGLGCLRMETDSEEHKQHGVSHNSARGRNGWMPAFRQLFCSRFSGARRPELHTRHLLNFHCVTVALLQCVPKIIYWALIQGQMLCNCIWEINTSPLPVLWISSVLPGTGNRLNSC